MPRVTFVKKARKNNPVVKKGESYYWWKFRHSGKCYSTTYPRQSQLTQSEFLGALYCAQEELEAWTPQDWEPGDEEAQTDPTLAEHVEDQSESLRDAARQCGESIREAGEESRARVDGMPDSLQDSPTAEMMNERGDESECMADALDNWADGYLTPEEDDANEDSWMDTLSAARDEACESAEYSGE